MASTNRLIWVRLREPWLALPMIIPAYACAALLGTFVSMVLWRDALIKPRIKTPTPSDLVSENKFLDFASSANTLAVTYGFKANSLRQSGWANLSSIRCKDKVVECDQKWISPKNNTYLIKFKQQDGHLSSATVLCLDVCDREEIVNAMKPLRP